MKKCNRPGCKNEVINSFNFKKDGSQRKTRSDKRYCSSTCKDKVWSAMYRPSVAEIKKLLTIAKDKL